MKQVIVLEKDLDMGKEASRARSPREHRVIPAGFSQKQDWVAEWFFQGQTKVCFKVDNEKICFQSFSAARKNYPVR